MQRQDRVFPGNPANRPAEPLQAMIALVGMTAYCKTTSSSFPITPDESILYLFCMMWSSSAVQTHCMVREPTTAKSGPTSATGADLQRTSAIIVPNFSLDVAANNSAPTG
jgi:hypothetical protein